MSLDRLHPSLAHHIVNTLGWNGLRPLQEAAIDPLLAGEDAILLAPTAGGKTEAAMFPLLSSMLNQAWSGLSVLYVCPIKALLNNLRPRLEAYSGWLGRRAGLWHGDVGASSKSRILADPPDILLTTPESLEGLLVSAKVDHRVLFSGLRAIVVDEVHAFAGDDRGWHLLAVLERLSRVAGRSIQRVGCSATVGNPEELLAWLQGSQLGIRHGRVVAPGIQTRLADKLALNQRNSESRSQTVDDLVVVQEINKSSPPDGDVELDYVGSIANAATVISTLHQGEKRLVFCDSRRLVEELGAALRARKVNTFLSHASLSADERRQAESAFAESRDCVIVATSTLELGIDVGDLDRVIQINAPRTVAAFLQRIGRTGRRTGTQRNCLFLAIDDDGLLDAAGLLHLWGRHWVEPVTPPPKPNHIVAQQILALCLQENRIGDKLWAEAWNGLAPFDESSQPILDHLLALGFLEPDGGMLFIGPEAEKKFGRRHFLELTSVFTAAPEFTVIAGREEIGRMDPSVFTNTEEGSRLLLLTGRSWRITHIDWKRRRCFTEPVAKGGKARWNSFGGVSGKSFQLMQSIRAVVLGEDPPVRITRRASDALAKARSSHSSYVDSNATVIHRSDDQLRWWTWAGQRANQTLRASIGSLAAPTGTSDAWLKLDPRTSGADLRILSDHVELLSPEPDERAISGLKFNTALDSATAALTLGARLSDFHGAAATLSLPRTLATTADLGSHLIDCWLRCGMAVRVLERVRDSRFRRTPVNKGRGFVGDTLVLVLVMPLKQRTVVFVEPVDLAVGQIVVNILRQDG